MTARSVSQPVAYIASVVAFLTVMAAAGAPSVTLSQYQHAWGFPDIALTVAFAIYAFVLLAALLVCGSLSDRLGRRPVVLAALGLNAIAMVQFLTAHDIAAVIAARAVQGAATGAATTVFSASIMELASARGRRTAEVLVSITTAGGLGIGVVLTGAATQFTGRPSTVVFGTALAIIVAAALVLSVSPETVTRQRGTAQRTTTAYVPRARISAAVRPRFVRLVPGVVGIWLSAGLILGLGASLAGDALDLGNGIIASVVVAAQPLTATVCTIVLAPRLTPRLLLPAGLAAVITGVTAEGISFLIENPALIVMGAIVTGLGFGAVFSGTLRDLLPHVRSHERAEFFAVFYIVGYLAYGLSAIAAGLLSDAVGLRWAAAIYAAATIIVTGAAAAVLAIPAKQPRRKHAVPALACQQEGAGR